MPGDHGDVGADDRQDVGIVLLVEAQDDGLNLGSIIETLNKDGAQSLMVQKFLPAISCPSGE